MEECRKCGAKWGQQGQHMADEEVKEKKNILVELACDGERRRVQFGFDFLCRYFQFWQFLKI